MSIASHSSNHTKGSRRGRKKAPRSERQHIGLLSAVFTHCWRNRYIAENPVDRMDKVHVDREVPKVLTTAQAWKAMARRQKLNFVAWLTLTLFCGTRPEAEADFVMWKEIDVDRCNRVVISKSKVRATRIIDLAFCPPALEWLRVTKAIKSPLPLAHITRRR